MGKKKKAKKAAKKEDEEILAALERASLEYAAHLETLRIEREKKFGERIRYIARMSPPKTEDFPKSYADTLTVRLAKSYDMSYDNVKTLVDRAVVRNLLRRAGLIIATQFRDGYDINLGSTWTQFKDMHSGGGSKEEWQNIFIEADTDDAVKIFYSRFGHNPYRVTCTCCGEDYSIDEGTISEISYYNRHPSFGKLDEMPLWEYEDSEFALFIRADEISDEERETYVPSEGYVWM